MFFHVKTRNGCVVLTCSSVKHSFNQRPDIVNPTAPSAASVYLRIFCFICSRATVLTCTCRWNDPRRPASGAGGSYPLNRRTATERISRAGRCEHLGCRISKNSGTFRVFRTYIAVRRVATNSGFPATRQPKLDQLDTHRKLPIHCRQPRRNKSVSRTSE